LTQNLNIKRPWLGSGVPGYFASQSAPNNILHCRVEEVLTYPNMQFLTYIFENLIPCSYSS